MPTGEEPGSAAPHQRERGFTYLWLLFAVLLSGAALAAIGERATVVTQRDREAELEFRGDAIRRAIASYWNASPLDARALPTSLQELTEDRRGPVVIRHLRRGLRRSLHGRTRLGAAPCIGRARNHRRA